MTADTVTSIDEHGASTERADDNVEPKEISALSSCMKAAGDPLRLQILSLLASGSFGVLELCHIFDSKQSGMSHHLKVLSRAELVSTRREGNSIFYRRNDSTLGQSGDALRSAIYSSAESIELPTYVSRNLSAVYSARAKTSESFFLNNAAAFKKQQDLIASFDVYGSEVAKLIDQSKFPKSAKAIEIGPGIGEFLPMLSQRFNEVIALDNAQSMLKRSREYCLKHDIDNVHFELGDTRKCTQWSNQLHCAVINMVLHHTPSPKQIFLDVAKCLTEQGVLIVCDLGAHDQDWVREACGDQWLGFSTEDLKDWAEKAKLKRTNSQFLALRNGFQIQIHQFMKQTD